jgi:hypothetical protein
MSAFPVPSSGEKGNLKNIYIYIYIYIYSHFGMISTIITRSLGTVRI